MRDPCLEGNPLDKFRGRDCYAAFERQTADEVSVGGNEI